jgi:hypothetical protein
MRRYHGKKDDDGANDSISALGWVGFERAQQSFGPGYPPVHAGGNDAKHANCLRETG